MCGEREREREKDEVGKGENFPAAAPLKVFFFEAKTLVTQKEHTERREKNKKINKRDSSPHYCARARNKCNDKDDDALFARLASF